MATLVAATDSALEVSKIATLDSVAALPARSLTTSTSFFSSSASLTSFSALISLMTSSALTVGAFFSAWTISAVLTGGAVLLTSAFFARMTSFLSNSTLTSAASLSSSAATFLASLAAFLPATASSAFLARASISVFCLIAYSSSVSSTGCLASSFFAFLSSSPWTSLSLATTASAPYLSS